MKVEVVDNDPWGLGYKTIVMRKLNGEKLPVTLDGPKMQQFVQTRYSFPRTPLLDRIEMGTQLLAYTVLFPAHPIIRPDRNGDAITGIQGEDGYRFSSYRKSGTASRTGQYS
ncbi:hypothetical protein QE152_g5212 [Popillia japonica]|uniref:Uncharacterized protein n=1 Tax=Popillia japonica TaxID=7064 RepID=A0AAW1MMS2_POPJA